MVSSEQYLRELADAARDLGMDMVSLDLSEARFWLSVGPNRAVEIAVKGQTVGTTVDARMLRALFREPEDRWSRIVEGRHGDPEG